ncbi:MAG: DUF5668 domain-containing protein [Treponema sp.]|jgi:hypothetical protein|nr:DUF5668 domain-containing protein [Treponema sp.]
MRLLLTRRTAARIIFIIGLFLMFLGIAFLISSLVEKSRLSVLISFSFIILGVGCAVLAIRLNKRSLYLFFAAFFLLTGLFLFLAALSIIPFSFSEAWPLLSVFSGIALFPAGWHRYGAFRSRYVVPSIAFVALGSVLMVFSLDLVSFSFAQFVKNWWPLLVVLAGLTLVLISLGTNNNNRELKE